jgi:hypothetical protein
MPVNRRRGGPRLSISRRRLSVRPDTCFATMGRMSKAVQTTLKPSNLQVVNAAEGLG